MIFTTLRIGLALAAAAVPAVGHAITMQEFVANRIERFGALKAANPQQPAQIEQIRQRTAAIVAALPPVSQVALDRPSVVWRTIDTPVVIFDDPVAPRMVVVPAGEYTMGSQPNERPARRRVRIDHALAVGMFPIVVGEFALFIDATGYKPATSCVTFEDGAFKLRSGRDWRDPKVSATPRDPVTCVSWADASAYAAWLSSKTGQQYRLLTEAEYEYINRAGTDGAYRWGDNSARGCAFANGFDQDAVPWAGGPQRSACHDGHAQVAQVGMSKPNPFGLFDTAGNVTSWVADCRDSHAHGVCKERTVRGGSWISTDLGSASFGKADAGEATSYRGFRLVRML